MRACIRILVVGILACMGLSVSSAQDGHKAKQTVSFAVHRLLRNVSQVSPSARMNEIKTTIAMTASTADPSRRSSEIFHLDIQSMEIPEWKVVAKNRSVLVTITD